MASDEAEEGSLEFTPTWIVAVVCSIIVFISLALERILHYLGKHLKKTNQKPLFEALQKVKEELMLLGFISLLLTVFQNPISHICIPKGFANHMLPCEKESASTESSHYQVFSLPNLLGGKRRLLAAAGSSNHCISKGKVQLLSLEAIHQLHIFIFVLAIVHVIFSVLTMLLGGAQIRQWKHWEDSIANDKYNTEEVLEKKVTHVQQHAFVKEHTLGFARRSSILSWLLSFFKQFYASVTKSDYITLRLGFIMTHCRGNPKFNFHKYMMRALEADFKKVVGISWYLWVFVIIFLLLNVGGWHTYFWIAFIPLITTYGFDSCIMGQVGFIIPRLIIGVIIQGLCSYSTLPLYAIVTQMGSAFQKAIFDEHVHENLVGWVQKAKKRKGFRPTKEGGDASSHTNKASGSSDGIQMQKIEAESLLEAGNANTINA
ncbi:unnamed protein product [Victoria cruziana]